MKLQYKILLPVMGLVLITMSVLTGVAYEKSKKALQVTIQAQLETMTHSTAGILAKFINDNKKLVTFMSWDPLYALCAEDPDPNINATVSNRMDQIRDQFGFFEALLISDKKGIILSGSGYDKANNTYTVTDRDYFKKAINGQLVLSEELLSRISGKPVFTIAAPIKREERIVGVLIAVVRLDAITHRFVDSIKISESGYALLLAHDGKVLAYPDKTQILKLNANEYEFSRRILEQKTGIMTYMFKGDEKISVFQEIPEKGWIVSINAPTCEIYAAAHDLRILLIILMIISLIVLGLCIFLIIKRSVTNRIHFIVQRLRDIAEGEGDLTHRIRIRANDELGNLGKWFNTFIEKLQLLMTDISQQSSVLTGSAQELNHLSDELSQSSGTVTGKSREATLSSDRVRDLMHQVAAAMEQSAAGTTAIASAAEEMTATIDEIAQNSDKARSITMEATGKAREVSGHVSGLEDAARGIGVVTETIADISDQTNLLALNATIEAARAGEAGKGFAVVAGEIKDLARQTAEATGEISDRILAIQQSAGTAISGIIDITNVITDVSEIVSGIAVAVEEQSATTREIAENVNQSSSGIQDVSRVTVESTAAAESVASEMADVLNVSDEMSESSQTLRTDSEKLKQLAETLSSSVGKFKI